MPDTQVFGVPQGHWSEYHDKELSSTAGDMVPPGEFDAGRALTEADQELAAAKSGADMQAAVVKTASALGIPRALTTIWLYRVPSFIGAVGAKLQPS